MEWNQEAPKQSGYYLAAWNYMGNGRSRRVSEFWFDGQNWWTGRQYINGPYPYDDVICYISEPQVCITDWVVAWMPKPRYEKSK